MGNNVEKKPKFFSNDGGDNYIIAKNVGVKIQAAHLLHQIQAFWMTSLNSMIKSEG